MAVTSSRRAAVLACATALLAASLSPASAVLGGRTRPPLRNGGGGAPPPPPPPPPPSTISSSTSGSTSGGGLQGPATAPTPLTNGVPINTFALPNTVQYFVFPTNFSLISSLTIVVTPTIGNPNLYALLGQRSGTLPAPPQGYQYSATSVSGIDAIRILSTDPVAINCGAGPGPGPGPGPAPGPCPVWIAVTAGPRLANFSISVNDGTTGTQLIANVPNLGTLYANATSGAPAPQYYSFVATIEFQQVSFTLNPLGTIYRIASPTLYIASSRQGSQFPNPADPSTYCAVAQVGSSGRAYAVIKYNDPITGSCFANFPGVPSPTYYAAVVPSSAQTGNQQYVIVASQQINSTQELLDGVALGNDGAYQQLDQYFYNAVFDNSTGRVIRISTLPIVGSVQIYATVDGSLPTDSNYQYSSQRFSGENEIAIRLSDPVVYNGACGMAAASNTSCVVNIAIYTFTSRSSYQVTARMGSQGRLINGISYEDYVAGNYNSYYFVVTRPNATATFRLEVLSGFVFMWIGSDAVPNTTNPNPSDPTSYFLSSQGNLYPSDQRESVAQGNVGFCSTPPCTYYIAVATAPTGNSSGGGYYSLTASLDGSPFQTLILNVPTADGIAAGPGSSQTPPYNAYFMYYPEGYTGGSPTSSLTFALDAVPGSRPTIGATVVAMGVTNISAVNPYAPQYSSRINFGDTGTQFTIFATDSTFATSCSQYIMNGTRYNASCAVLVWVYADTVASQYSILPFAGARQLVEGQIITSVSPANMYTYFRFTVASYQYPITITVTPVYGDPDLYVGIGVIPNATTNTFSSTSTTAEIIQITWDSNTVKNAIARANLTRPWDILISVFGNGGPATFNIQVESSVIPYLSDNLRTSGLVAANSLTYFYFLVPPASNSSTASGVLLNWQTISGSQLIVLANNVVPPNASYPLIPRCNGACTPTGVNTFVNAPISSLNNGLPGQIDIDPSDRLYRSGVDYVIGVYSPTVTTFFITASYIRSVQQLSSGITVSGAVTTCNYTWYVLNVNVPFVSVSFTLTATTVDTTRQNPALYASTITRRPGPYNYTKTANAANPLTADVITFLASDLTLNGSLPSCNNRPNGCNIWVSVYGANRTTNPGCNFGTPIVYTLLPSILTNVTSYTLLQAGAPLEGTLESNTAAYYYAPLLLTPGTPVSISLSPVVGSSDVFVTTDGTTPSPTNAQFYSNASLGVDYIYIPSTSPYYRANMTLRIAVYTPPPPFGTAPPPAAVYYIWYSLGSSTITQMIQNVAETGAVDPGQFNYYYFAAPSSSLDITFQVTPTSQDADPDLYVANYNNIANNTNFRPGPGVNCANSTNDGGDFLIVPGITGTPSPAPNVGNYATNCRIPGLNAFLIAVGCSSRYQCVYSLTASLGDYTPILLTEGRTQNILVPNGTLAYVAVDISASLGTGRNFTITASAGTNGGNTALYATNIFVPGVTSPASLPTATSNAIWRAPTSGQPLSSSAGISISPSDPAFVSCLPNTTGCNILVAGVYSDAGGVIAVNAFSAGGAPTQLILGYPSAPSGLNGGATRSFVANILDTTQDLTIFVTLISGSASAMAVSIDPFNPATTCVDVAGNLTCNGVWVINPSAAQITITAASPCANAVSHCNNATDGSGSWRPGGYFITVYAASLVEFSITAVGKLTAVPLADSLIASRTATSTDAALYDYTPDPIYSSDLFPIRFFLDAGAQGVSVYMNSCIDGQCQDSDRAPSPGVNAFTFDVAPYSAAGPVINSTLPSTVYCRAPLGGTCHYYIAVYPTYTCNSPTCSAPFSIAATQITGGTMPMSVPSSITSGTVAVFPYTNVAVGGNQPYEFYLDPSRGPWDLRITIDACGPSYVAMYGCNPDVKTAACGNAFKPTRGSSDYAAHTAGNGGKYGGSATLLFPGVVSGAAFATLFDDNSTTQMPSSSEYLSANAIAAASTNHLSTDAQSVVAPGPRRRQLQSSGPGYILTIGASNSAQPAYFVAAGVRSGVPGGISVLTPDPNSTQKLIRWSAATYNDARGNVIGPLVNVVYNIYIAYNGFNGTISNTIPGSQCGLDQWSRVTRNVAYSTTNRSLAVTGLASTGFYEVNVVAICDATCWNATGVLSATGSSSSSSSSFRQLQSSSLGLTQTATQVSAYTPTNFTDSVPEPGPENIPASGVDGAIIGGGVGGGIAFLICLCAIGFMIRRRRPNSSPKENMSQEERQKRVEQLRGAAVSAPVSPSASAMAVEVTAARAGRAEFAPASTGGAAPAGAVTGWK